MARKPQVLDLWNYSVLDFRVGRINVEIIDSSVERICLQPLMNYLLEGNAPLPSASIRPKRTGFGGIAPRNFKVF